MHFRIDPLNNAGLGSQKIIVFMSFNASTIRRPFGRNVGGHLAGTENLQPLDAVIMGN